MIVKSGARMCNIYVCMCVCVFVCLSRTSRRARVPCVIVTWAHT